MDPTQETIDYIAVRRLQDAYADVVSRRAWGELEDLFLPDVSVIVDVRADAPYVFNGPQEFATFVAKQVDRFEFFQFVILNSVLTLAPEGDPDVATGRMHMSELRQHHADGRWTLIYGLYRDRYTRIDGRWWFAERRYSSLARTQPEMDVFGYPEM